VEWSRDAAGLVQVIKAMEEGLMKTQLVQAYANSLKVVWVSMCGLAAVALLTSFFVKEFSLQQEMVTEQGFKHKTKVVDSEASDTEKTVDA